MIFKEHTLRRKRDQIVFDENSNFQIQIATFTIYLYVNVNAGGIVFWTI